MPTPSAEQAMDDFHGHDDGFAAADFGIQECGSERGSRHHEESEAGRVEPRAKRARRGSTTTMDEELPRPTEDDANFQVDPQITAFMKENEDVLKEVISAEHGNDEEGLLLLGLEE
ncbi:hypothetical protein E2P81_ATG04399 [Venturia nashicola]|nr:hypothetical protein E2P81_ATG04399 [Venturia nashicola]